MLHSCLYQGQTGFPLHCRTAEAQHFAVQLQCSTCYVLCFCTDRHTADKHPCFACRLASRAFCSSLQAQQHITLRTCVTASALKGCHGIQRATLGAGGCHGVPEPARAPSSHMEQDHGAIRGSSRGETCCRRGHTTVIRISRLLHWGHPPYRRPTTQGPSRAELNALQLFTQPRS